MPSANHLLRSLSAIDFEALRPHLEVIELTREAVLVEAGAPLTHIYLPDSGIISLIVSLSEGQAVEVAMIGHDSVFGASAALDGRISLTDAVVLLPGTASILDVNHLRRVAGESIALRTLLMRHEQALFAQAQQSAACNASHPAEARLARWLLRARDLSGSETLPMTQELLAHMIGVQRNAVSIIANALQQAGIIRYVRGLIEITDLKALKQRSCECYQAVKMQHDRLLDS